MAPESFTVHLVKRIYFILESKNMNDNSIQNKQKRFTSSSTETIILSIHFQQRGYILKDKIKHDNETVNPDAIVSTCIYFTRDNNYHALKIFDGIIPNGGM